MQLADTVFLVRPASFGYNAQTAVSNAFQQKGDGETNVSRIAQAEFDAFAAGLKDAGVNVLLFNDSPRPQKPDAIFPNNWISLHADGTLVLYPMCTPNRRTERDPAIVDEIKKRFTVSRIVDLSGHEKEGKFLEGTGSIVFDHKNKVAYACLSARTNKKLFDELCALLGYSAVSFYAHDENGKEIYHTNVMMCVSEGFAVICSESITDGAERKLVLGSLAAGRLELVEITRAQMNLFAGNMLGLKSMTGQKLLVLSQSAYDALLPKQLEAIKKYASPLPLSIPTIEKTGGGSARCMIAEIFLEKR